MANKDIYEIWLQGIELAMQKMHPPDAIRDVDLTMVNGMMVRSGIRSGVEQLAVGTTTYGNSPLVSYESGACGSYASGACVSCASGACNAGPIDQM